MSQVVDHLARLTGFRDRDVMDVTLVAALRDLLEPLSVAIFRCSGHGVDGGGGGCGTTSANAALFGLIGLALVLRRRRQA